MFLAAIFVVLLSILYLLYNLQEDAPVNNPNCVQDVAETTPSRRGTTTEGASVRRAQGGALNIFFGSQTGTAEAFAKSLARVARRRGFAPSVFDLQHFDEALLMLPTARTAPPAVFLLATYGEGEPTDNARRFCKWLKDHAKKSRHLAPLQGLRFAVFGLGDRRYEQFNPVALLVDKQLALLGAHHLLHIGLGDDAKDLTADFSRWTSAFWAAFDPSDSPCPTSHTPPHAKTHSTSSTAYSHSTLRAASALADNNKLASDEEDVVFTIDSFASREEALAAMRDRGLNNSTSCMLDALPICRGVVRRKLELHRGGPRSCLHLEVESAEDAWRSAAAAEEVEKEEEEEEEGEGAVKGATTARLAPLGRLGQLRWETGDHVGVHARNSSALVRALLDRLRACKSTERQSDTEPARERDRRRERERAPTDGALEGPGLVRRWLVVRDDTGALALPSPTTLEQILEEYVDISGAPSARVLGVLARHCRDPSQKMHLQHMAANKEALRQRVTSLFKSIVSLLQEFDAVNVPIEVLLAALPRLRPRYYSISSSSSATPASIHITALVVAHALPPAVPCGPTVPTVSEGGGEFKGLCTGYLTQLAEGDAIFVSVRRSGFKLPPSLDTPVILVGVGTGIAPLRAMYLERQHLRQRRSKQQQQQQQQDVAGAGRGGRGREWVDEGGTLEDLLFFGCRRREEDLLYAEELEELEREGATRVLTALSRQTPREKVYVQHRIAENAMLVARLLKRGACVYVCGGTGMAKDVKAAFSAALAQDGDACADESIALLQASGRYLQDLWG